MRAWIPASTHLSVSLAKSVTIALLPGVEPGPIDRAGARRSVLPSFTPQQNPSAATVWYDGSAAVARVIGVRLRREEETR